MATINENEEKEYEPAITKPTNSTARASKRWLGSNRMDA